MPYDRFKKENLFFLFLERQKAGSLMTHVKLKHIHFFLNQSLSLLFVKKDSYL